MAELIETVQGIIQRGGPIMYPLIILSIAALVLIVERAIFWFKTNSSTRIKMVQQVNRALRDNKKDQALNALGNDQSIYAYVIREMLQTDHSDALAAELVEDIRPVAERYMTLLGTTITAAPMLGILGTVTGIINSFDIFSGATLADPTQIGAGIAEALITTVFGLIIALVVIFPFNAYRTQIDRTLGRIENSLIALQEGEGKKEDA